VKREEIYLETSVWNFLYADDAPDKKEVTEVFFTGLTTEIIYASDLVRQEISKAPPEKERNLRGVISSHRPIILREVPDVLELSGEYVNRGIFPPRYDDDATHVA
jgi:hypothetical protein